MRNKTKIGIIFFMSTLLFAVVSCDMGGDRYEASWPSLKQHKTPSSADQLISSIHVWKHYYQ